MQFLKRKWRFDVQCQPSGAGSTPTVVALAASSTEEKQRWLAALREAAGPAASDDATGAGATVATGAGLSVALESHPYLDIGRRAAGSSRNQHGEDEMKL